jgi:GDP-L-fucose synthase
LSIRKDDLGDACVFSLEHWQPGPEQLQFLNVGTCVDLSIRELAEQVAAASGYPASRAAISASPTASTPGARGK